MDKYTAQNLAELANLGQKKLDLPTALKFLEKFSIGKEGIALPGLSFPGIRFAPMSKQKENQFVFFSHQDIQKAREFAKTMVGTINFEESVQKGKHVFITKEDLEDLNFNWIYDDEWASRLCNVLEYFSKEARAFLTRIIEMAVTPANTVDQIIYKGEYDKLTQFMLEFINNKFQMFLHHHTSCLKIGGNNSALRSGEIQLPRIEFSPFLNFYSTINDEINAKFYISPYLTGANHIWEKARICSECGRFFFFKQQRARFCSQKCRMNVANRERRGK